MKSILLVATIYLFLSNFAQADQGTFSVVTKDVFITKKDRPEEKARRGLKVNVGDKIRTAKDSYAKILMNDKNILHVGPESEMLLKEYQTKVENVESSTIEVLYGQVRSALDKKYDGKSENFKVNSEAAVIGVRGTDFLTTHIGASNTSKLVVFRGKVQTSGLDSTGKMLGEQEVNAGEATSIVKGQPPQLPVKVPEDLLKQLDSGSLSAEKLPMSIPGLDPVAAQGAAGAASGTVAGAGLAGGAAAGAVGGLLGAMASDSGDDKKENKSKEATVAASEKPAEKEEKKKELVDEKKPEPIPEEKKAEEKKADIQQEQQASPIAITQDQGDIELQLKVGTLGASVSLAYPLSKDFHFKIDAYNTLKYKYKQNDKGEEYEATIDFKGVGLLAQFNSSGFLQYLLGVYFVQNKIKVEGTPLGTETIGDTDYNFSAGSTMYGTGEFDVSAAPYLGLGWRFSLLGLLDITGDIGGMYIGKLQVDKLEYNGPTTISATDVQGEIKEIEKEMDKFKVWPVVRVGIGLHF